MACPYFVACFWQIKFSHLCPKIQENLGKQPGLPISSNELDLTWDAKHGIRRRINLEVIQKPRSLDSVWIWIIVNSRRFTRRFIITLLFIIVSCNKSSHLWPKFPTPYFIHPKNHAKLATAGSQAKPSLAKREWGGVALVGVCKRRGVCRSVGEGKGRGGGVVTLISASTSYLAPPPFFPEGGSEWVSAPPMSKCKSKAQARLYCGITSHVIVLWSESLAPHIKSWAKYKQIWRIWGSCSTPPPMPSLGGASHHPTNVCTWSNLRERERSTPTPTGGLHGFGSWAYCYYYYYLRAWNPTFFLFFSFVN